MAHVTLQTDGKVLACVDRSHFADHVADYAIWAAKRLDAPLEFLYVIDRHPEIGSGDDHSGAIGVDAQENLLTRLSGEDEIRAKSAREEGRILLNRLRERAVLAGVGSVDVRQRQGALDETLLELEPDVRLLVMGRRGESAEVTRRELGRNVETVLRSMNKPVLAVTEEFREPSRVMIAFDGGIGTRRGVQLVAASPLLRGLPIKLLMAGTESGEAGRQLNWAKETLESAGFSVEASMVSGDAERLIGETIQELSINLLLMGAYSHSRWRSMLFGSTTTDLLRAARIPTLIVR